METPRVPSNPDKYPTFTEQERTQMKELQEVLNKGEYVLTDTFMQKFQAVFDYKRPAFVDLDNTLIDENSINPHALAVLQKLHNNGIPIVLWTSRIRSSVNELLPEGLQAYIDLIITGDNYIYHKMNIDYLLQTHGDDWIRPKYEQQKKNKAIQDCPWLPEEVKQKYMKNTSSYKPWFVLSSSCSIVDDTEPTNRDHFFPNGIFLDGVKNTRGDINGRLYNYTADKCSYMMVQPPGYHTNIRSEEKPLSVDFIRPAMPHMVHQNIS